MNIRLTLIGMAIVGYTLSYSSVYAFHLMVAVWLSITWLRASDGETTEIVDPQLVYPVFALFAFCIVSIIWNPDPAWGIRYNFYVLCGMLVLMAVYQSTVSRVGLNRVFALSVSIVGLNLLIGLGETLSLFRLPVSIYSPYISYFGYTGADLEEVRMSSIHVLTKPTGFNWNPNNFGFVVLIAFPFILFSRSLTLKLCGSLICVWLLLAIGSRGHFLALVLLFAAWLFYLRPTWGTALVLLASPIVALIAYASLLYFGSEARGVARMLTTADQIVRGLQLMLYADAALSDSTSTRAAIYAFSLKELWATYGWGLGLGGTEARLVQEGFRISKVHFFFLQMLTDLGVFVFGLFLSGYAYLIIQLKRWSRKVDDGLSYYARASSLALFVAIPASLAPSTVIYLLTYWVLIGFALAVLRECRHA